MSKQAKKSTKPTPKSQLKAGKLYLEPALEGSSKSLPNSISVIRINKAGNDNDYEWEEWAFESPGGKLIFHWTKEQLSEEYFKSDGILEYLSYKSWDEFWKVVKRVEEVPDWFLPYVKEKK